MDIGVFFKFCFIPFSIFYFLGYLLGSLFQFTTPTRSASDNDDNNFFYTAMWMDD